MEILSSSPEETQMLGEIIGTHLCPGDIIGVAGEIGVGKTCLIQGMARGLGVQENVTSSSFILMRVYQGRFPVYHFDFYRLILPEEILDLGYEEYFFGDGVSLLEWEERVKDFLPAEYLHFEMEYVPGFDCHRRIKILPRGDRYRRIIEEIARDRCTGS